MVKLLSPSRTLPLLQIDSAELAQDPSDGIDNCKLVYGDVEVDDFGTVLDPCDRSPVGQHEYSMRDRFARCIHCAEPSRL